MIGLEAGALLSLVMIDLSGQGLSQQYVKFIGN